MLLTSNSKYCDQFLEGHALTVLKELPSESVDCCITSPPYWKLRDYHGPELEWGDGWKGQLGQEAIPQLYINHLCEIFNEIKRVLKPSGSLWVNLGDSYSNSGGSGASEYSLRHKQFGKVINKGIVQNPHKASGLPVKTLVLVPQLFVIDMVYKYGWILRNEIIWHKPGCLPTPVKDRFTIDYEKFFFFVKQPRYFFEQQFEPYADSSEVFYRKILRTNKQYNSKYNRHIAYCDQDKFSVSQKKGRCGEKYIYTGQAIKDYDSANAQNPSDTKRRILKSMAESVGRNKRTVWSVNTKPFNEAHFATFPQELISSPLLATCPESICLKCHKPRKNVYRKGEVVASGGGYQMHEGNTQKLTNGQKKEAMVAHEYFFEGLSDCGCQAGWYPGIVLDPFMGAGTVAVEAIRQKKHFIGIEINPEYIQIAKKRLADYQVALQVEEKKVLEEKKVSLMNFF